MKEAKAAEPSPGSRNPRHPGVEDYAYFHREEIML